MFFNLPRYFFQVKEKMFLIFNKSKTARLFVYHKKKWQYVEHILKSLLYFYNRIKVDLADFYFMLFYATLESSAT